LLAGIGFTMALFIANLAFSPDMIGEAKLGIFAASVVSAAAGLLLLRTSSRSLHGFTPDASRMPGILDPKVDGFMNEISTRLASD
jgi:hypothetical protein